MEGSQSQSNGGGKPSVPHVLLISQSLVSHSLPMLRIATQLAAHGMTVSFVTYEDEVSGLSAQILLGKGGEKVEIGRNFQFLGVPRPATIETKWRANEFREEMKPIVEKFVRDKESGEPCVPTCIIADMFFSWTQAFSESLETSRYILVTGGVVFGKHLLEYSSLYDSGVFKIGEDGKLLRFEGHISTPGLPSLSYEDMPMRSKLMAQHSLDSSRALWTSNGVLFNSFSELEEEIVEAWNLAGVSQPHQAKVPAVYPLAFSSKPSSTRFVPAGSEDSGEISYQWLQSQAPSSVIYVAFGSKFLLSPDQTRELALGLEASEQHFLWVIPKSKDSSDNLPHGLRERVRDRACLVSGWVPQVEILEHPATAAFLTHCGWNSCLEGITTGVPLIAWPQGAEQRLNCRYLVDLLKIAYGLPTSGANVAGQEHVKEAVQSLLVKPEKEGYRTRIKELQKKAKIAASETGSQSRNLQNLVQDIHDRFASQQLS